MLSDPKLHEIFTNALELIRDPHHWTQLVYARDAEGYPRSEIEPEACQFCVMGAVNRVIYDQTNVNDFPPPHTSRPFVYLDNLALELFSGTVPWVNDELGHESAIVLLATAAARTAPEETSDDA